MANKDFKVKNGIDIQTPLPVSMGGTGQTSTTNTLNSLLPAQGGNQNKVLQTDGTNTTWYTLPSAYTRGGTASRPGSPTAGDLHFNTDKKAFEVWTGDAWVSVAVNGAVPLPPTIGTVTVSGLTASVPFTGPTDFGDAAISTYTATSNPGGITASNATSPISVSGLTANTSYTFTVTATNSFGVSNPSAASNSITTATTPGAPTSVTVTDPGTDGYAAVSWTAPASNGGSAITDYVIQYSSNSGSSWTTFSDGTSTSTSATVTGLTLNTAYIFRVAAVNVIGTGSYSTVSSSFTPVAHDSGVMFPLQVITVGAAGASSIDFTNIPTTGYSHLQVRVMSRDSRAVSTNGLSIRVGNGSIDTGNNYNTHMIRGDGSSVTRGSAGTNYNNMDFALEPGASISSSIFGASIFEILDYANTNKYKTMRSLNGYDANGSGYIVFHSGLWMNTAAINTIRFTCSGSGATFAPYSQFALYGVKSA